jgi:hypothetical protein
MKIGSIAERYDGEILTRLVAAGEVVHMDDGDDGSIFLPAYRVGVHLWRYLFHRPHPRISAMHAAYRRRRR